MEPLIRKIAILATLMLAAGCAQPRYHAGPLTLAVPSGWRVTRASEQSVQIADGTEGKDMKVGSATAVFDIYFESKQDAAGYRKLLTGPGSTSDESTIRIDRKSARRFSYNSPSFAGKGEAVLIPDYKILIVYRAAYPNDGEAFEKGLPSFREAVASIKFPSGPSRLLES